MKHIYSHRNPKQKTCAVVRYGALGDAIQMSSVLPGIKAEGYRIVAYVVPIGYEALKHDPHIDEFVVQDVDAIPNELLGEFWTYLEKKYDKFVNLCESVESTLLTMPGNMSFTWSHQMRHKHLNKNYLEFAHDIAGVPMPSRPKFYQTDGEAEWARREYASMGGIVIAWVLAGSGIHKTWPYVDEVMIDVMTRNPEVRIAFLGGADDSILEAGWEKEPRVFRRCGAWHIRQTLSFAKTADLVIGPETGILNAVAIEPVDKIVLLSHSSKENLTRDWVNTTSLTPRNTSCYPCHKLHQNKDGFKYCRESHIKGIAACQADIPPQDMIEAINKVLEKKNGKANRQEEKLAA